MFLTIARNWWAVLIRGILSLIFGVLCLVFPFSTIIVLAMFFGAYALVDGIFAIVSMFMGPRSTSQWGVLLLEGIVGIIIGLITFFMPGVTALGLVYLIAAWAVVTGIFEIIAAIRLRKEITGEWMLILGGVLSVLFGLLVGIFPGAGALTIVVWIGVFAIFFGIVFIILAFRLRSWHKQAPSKEPI